MQIPLRKRLTETDRKPLPHSSYDPIQPRLNPDELQITFLFKTPISPSMQVPQNVYD